MAGDPQNDHGILEETRPKTQKPTLYRVILLNDDYTTMEFVVQILETVFHKTPSAAHQIMMQVHTLGHGVCGAYSYEVAETKVATVQDLARRDGFPLQATLEEE
ncbi:MAG: ATP-dependent Clp protease adapter ClpS [Acidobacteria bacterium]|jgi:ATP-dependent Clp protease adaptor protein ClpS|nr:ATP-dependent Clp protease adapter ClpS [Acidobacteriota bacterium]MDP7339339.1 ATP-dependent Clp protease adapter ClpS [Vicinamibacterales bacterium]MDP7479688.1 ATP-dependent Clp protease adapter ClpS [Vicinamibacterales bacterium]MDP7691297.1 ATP-dependent Clp protease adapter ClpS [Vicinamibacterales bacterium]HJN46767.1 ATP-dependent Clp protease adapter ClpS [Vicinamibacterales bacterium]|tara:strand:+ start:324 stop:635 length:312 start_codon:yes stop_codon:yes gene_type:complete